MVLRLIRQLDVFIPRTGEVIFPGIDPSIGDEIVRENRLVDDNLIVPARMPDGIHRAFGCSIDGRDANIHCIHATRGALREDPFTGTGRR